VKNIQKEEIPLVNIERSPLFLLISVALCSVLIYFGYALLMAVNPWGFIVMIPATIVFFQLLWLFVNPYAIIFDDKIEFKQSFFHNKLRYFVDIKKISESKSGKIYITYNDDEMEALNLFGIKTSHAKLLKTEIEKFVSESLKTRP
jgi:hypothetical protein